METKDNLQAKHKENCLLYLTSYKNGFQGFLWILKKDDAMAICSSKYSKGYHWNIQWTSIYNFIHRNDIYHKQFDIKKVKPILFIKDKGICDEAFEEIGIDKPTKNETVKLLQECKLIGEYR